MLDLIRQGGWSMLFVFVLGSATWLTSVALAFRPSERGIAIVRALSAATAFIVLAGLSANVAAVMHNVPSLVEAPDSPELSTLIMVGLGESLAPAILGFALLSLAWLSTAFGLRRLAA